jgi:hypothetical protein
MANGMTPQQFIAKWRSVELSERAASQEHFIDLCRLLGQPTPAEHDATGAEYTFEKGVAVTGGASAGARGDRGFADVWWRGKFGWEYKRRGKYRDLTEAYRQLCQYREALENPPLLIVSDIGRTEIHTNFTGTRKEVHCIPLEEFDRPEHLDKLRRVFTAPESFRPELTTQKVTEEIAEQIGLIARGLIARGHDPHAAAHFLMKCMFCLFAEDVHLLPDGLFKRLLQSSRREPDRLTGRLTQLFSAMRTGGDYGPEDIPWFNGGLFDEAPALELTEGEIKTMLDAAGQDWGAVEPAIFGTLFERSLDPNKRAQIGAHYTSREDIMLIVEPVVMAPLRREWAAVQESVNALIEKRNKSKNRETKRKAETQVAAAIEEYLDRLAKVRILDPACGSGNFLYVAIQQLLNLEKEVITFAARPDIAQGLFPKVRPTQLHGIEMNPYAAELAQVVIWIGYLQWMRENGFIPPSDPILAQLRSVECRDAILDLSDPRLPVPAKWPEADFIIGNPPFLGSKQFRQNGLDDEYVDAMFSAYELPKTSDLCCYWFEQARASFVQCPRARVGLLATQGIRGGDNRAVLQRIKDAGDLFMAWADREWILDGAAVHVSIVGFDAGQEDTRELNGQSVTSINSNLTAEADTTLAKPLKENEAVGWSIGTQKGGSFEFDHAMARQLLHSPNPNGRPNTEVVCPWRNASDLTGRLRGLWIIDFGASMPEREAAGYEAPFEYLRKQVKPDRDTNRRNSYRLKWWIHQEPRNELRPVLEAEQVLLTPRVSKYRLWVSADSTILPDCQVIVFARSDMYCFGVLHSALHELWARGTGTQLREAESGFRYTPSTCFETFPLPWPPRKEPADHPAYVRISAAAKALNEQRERWLNPPEWIEPLAARIDAADDFADVPAEARPLIRQSAIMAAAAEDPQLKRRTLTNLYNERPTWLKLSHQELDRAALSAYAAIDPDGGWSEDWAEVWLDTGAGQPLPDDHPLAARRKEIDQRVLANLLRLNLQRAS